MNSKQDIQSMMSRFLSHAITFCLSLIVLAGCGGGSDEKPTGTVTGKLTYKMQPLGNVNVNFSSPDTGAAAMAEVEADGTFEFSTPIPAGTYKVYLSPPTPPAPGSGEPVVSAPPNLPPTYMQLETSTLSAKVEAGSKNEILLDLQ